MHTLSQDLPDWEQLLQHMVICSAGSTNSTRVSMSRQSADTSMSCLGICISQQDVHAINEKIDMSSISALPLPDGCRSNTHRVMLCALAAGMRTGSRL